MPVAGREATQLALTQPLVDYLAGLRFEDLPAPVVRSAQAALLDHLACVVYGMDQPWLQAVRTAVLPDARPDGAAPVLRTGLRTTAGDAAFVNGTAAHGFELDDIYYRTHPGSVVIPAAIACLGRDPRDGRDLLSAIVAGYEMIGRVARSIGVAHSDRGFHTMGVAGPFGAAAAAAHVRGLGARQSNSAIGIAASFGSGIKAFVHGPGMVKRLHAGQAAKNGILAADLAAAGFLGPEQPLEGRFGFCRVFAPDDGDLGALGRDLGRDFAVADTYLKPYSACGALHGVIRAAERLRADHGIGVDDVESVVIGTTAHGRQKSQPHPVDVMATQYSLESGAVLGLLGRAGDPTSFRPEVVTAGAAGRVLDSVSVRTDDEAERNFPKSMDSRVTVRLRDGRELSAYGVGHAHGDLNLAPAQRWEAAASKFGRLAGPLLPAGRPEQVIAEIRALAEGATPDGLLALLA